MLSYGALVSIVLIVVLTDGFLLPNQRRLIRQDETTEKAESTLVLSHVMFRHGNRTPELSELYPKDPYLNYSYYPLTHGQLTTEGKRKEYSIGQALRTRYDTHLGKYYTQGLMDSWSTDRNRTKSSLLLVLASLFPPKCSEVWMPNLDWQPVPYNYRLEKDDPILYGISCPTFLEEYEAVHNSPEVQAEFNEYVDIFKYVAENSGLNVTRFQNIYDLYFGLSTEEEYGFELPEWTKKVWPDIVNEISYKQYGIYTKTTLLKKMAAGYFLQKMINDTEARINNETVTKLYLYSAHENNIGQLFATLDLFEYPHIPTYGTYVLFEVHLIDNVYGFKIYYQNYNGTVNPKLLKLPACDEFCPLDTFKSLVEEYLPEYGLCGN